MQSNSRQRAVAYGMIRILLGFVCATNMLFHANSVFIAHFLSSFAADWVLGQPRWLAAYGHFIAHGVRALGPTKVAWATVVVDGVLAASLLTGIWLQYLAWLGIAYYLWFWTTIGGFGGPYVPGTTDVGTAVIYAFGFGFVIATRAWARLSLLDTGRPQTDSALGVRMMRILFGLLWAFTAFWKWQPYFLIHSADYLRETEIGQPAWVVSYLGWFLSAISVIGPVAFGVVVALSETAIALSLLTGRFLRGVLPFGIVYCLGLWVAAEGFGGPYGAGFTGVKGDLLGTANIYLFPFLFLIVATSWPSRNINDAVSP